MDRNSDRAVPAPRFMACWAIGTRRQALTELFAAAGKPVHYRTIAKWDAGDRYMPLWARELVLTDLERRIAQLSTVAGLLRRFPPFRKYGHARHKARELGSRGGAARKASYEAGLRWKNKKGARKKRAPDLREPR